MMNMYEIAERFREAIETAKDERVFKWNSPLLKFPCGCCGIASDYLSCLLKELGIETIEVCGEYNDKEEGIIPHAWLVMEENVIIDVTGDQFMYYDDSIYNDVPVYVGKLDGFHKAFIERYRYEKPYEYILNPCDQKQRENYEEYCAIKQYYNKI